MNRRSSHRQRSARRAIAERSKKHVAQPRAVHFERPSRIRQLVRRWTMGGIIIGIIVVTILIVGRGCTSTTTSTNGDNVTFDIPPAVLAFDGSRAFNLLAYQVGMGARVPNSKSHEQCATWLEEQLRKYTSQLITQEFTVSWEGTAYSLTNIIGVFTSANASGWTLLLGAHWDSRPTADCDPDEQKRNEPVPGANDGASGVAVLLEIARVLSIHQPPVTVLIALFDGEDFGEWVYGSRYYVNHPAPYMPDAVIIIDMVGDAELHINRELNSVERAPKLWNGVMSSVSALNLNEYFNNAPLRVFDDHVPFLDAGIPAIDIIDFDYPYWHTTQDTPDKCDAKSLTIVGRVLLHFIFVGAEEYFGG